jgi:hypothetical protein
MTPRTGKKVYSRKNHHPDFSKAVTGLAGSIRGRERTSEAIMNRERAVTRLQIIELMLTIAISGQRAASAQHPVRWTRAVGPPSRQALKAKLQSPVKKPASQKIFEHGGRKREIRTCADYERAKRNGWEDDANGYEHATESFFKDACDSLLLILAAKESRVSYVTGLRLNEASLDELPPSMSFAPIGEVEEKAAEAERQGLSWKKFKPGLKILTKGANAVSVEEPGEARINLEIKAFGDFNGDGVEDVLLIKSDRAIGGTFFAMYPVILSRLNPHARLKVVEIKEEK